jgi:hypothetical protein
MRIKQRREKNYDQDRSQSHLASAFLQRNFSCNPTFPATRLTLCNPPSGLDGMRYLLDTVG